jgi:hypothetical protein
MRFRLRRLIFALFHSLSLSKFLITPAEAEDESIRLISKTSLSIDRIISLSS